MFNYAGATPNFRTGAVLGGFVNGDFITHKTLYAGPDPADPTRALIRKLVQVNAHTYCFEETRITPGENDPTVHT